jgi:hypothetical protein
MSKIQWNGPVEDDNAEECPRCDGSGFEDEFSDEICRECLGTCEVPRLAV